MVIESQYILALYNQKGPPGRTLSTPLVLYTTASKTSGSPCFMAEVYFEPPDVLGQSLETFDCSSYCLCLCILGTVFLFLCSPPVSACPLLCAGVPAPLSSRGVPSSCKPPPALCPQSAVPATAGTPWLPSVPVKGLEHSTPSSWGKCLSQAWPLACPGGHPQGGWASLSETVIVITIIGGRGAVGR